MAEDQASCYGVNLAVPAFGGRSFFSQVVSLESFQAVTARLKSGPDTGFCATLGQSGPVEDDGG
jgi:hypothetical protein